MIAADANKSGVITTFDVVVTRKVILHILPNFTDNTSWRFVDSNHTFPDPANPFAEPFPEVCNINNFTATSQSPNFVAIKTGDLNHSAIGNLHAANEDRTVTNELVFYIDDKFVKKGEQVEVSFRSDLAGFLAYQFTLGFDNGAIELSDILPGNGMSASNFGTAHLDEGMLTVSWFQVLKTEKEGANEMFQLLFTAKEDGQLSEMLQLNSRLTKAESNDAEGNAFRSVWLSAQTLGFQRLPILNSTKTYRTRSAMGQSLVSICRKPPMLPSQCSMFQVKH